MEHVSENSLQMNAVILTHWLVGFTWYHCIALSIYLMLHLIAKTGVMTNL